MNSETSTLQVSPADPAQPLKITLVWTDAPGPMFGGATRALTNNLDLTVVQGTNTFLGNVFASGWSITGGVADDLNNVENVYIQTPGGVYDITVKATEIVGDGVPYNADLTDQDFALVCYNCAVPADLSITKSDSPDPVTPGGALTYSLAVTNNGPGDATDVTVTDTLPTGVTFDLATSSPGCTEVVGVVTCDLGNLANGTSATVTIAVTIDATASCASSLTNNAVVASNESDPNSGDNTATADTTINCPAGLNIRPEEFPNRIRLGGGDDHGVRIVHVAILSNSSFDAPNDVDRQSLTFGHSGNENSLHRQGKDCWRNDVNHDGLLDLVCNFVIRRTGFQASDTVGILKGKLLDGTTFEAQDSVVIIIGGDDD